MKIGWEITAVLACFLHFTACVDSGPHPPAGVVRDSAGIRLIELPPFPTLETELVLAIDSSWAPAEGLEIGRLTDIAVAPGDRVLLLDELESKITVLSTTGEVEAVFGRTGEGPGEFNGRGLRNLVTTDSSVLVPDLHLQRITEFSFSGEVLAITTFPLSPVYAVDWRRHPGGGLAFRALEQTGDLLIRMVGDEVDTLFTLPITNDTPNLLLAPQALWDLTPEGHFVVGRSDQPLVEFRAEGLGTPIWIARRSDLGDELGEDARLHLEGLVTESARRQSPGASAEELAQMLAFVQYPDRAPVFAGIFSAPGGDIWVRHAQPVRSMGLEAMRVGSSEAFGGPDWDVLNSDGLLRARVRLPEGFTPRRFWGSRRSHG